MGSFAEQPFAQRFGTLGDTAESVYDHVLPLGQSTQYGFRRPKGIKFATLPEKLRHAPDRVTPTYFVEVAGMGRDGVLKTVKVEKFEAMKAWDKIARQIGLLGLVLFVWNSSKKQYVVLGMKSLVKMVKKSEAEFGIQAFEVDGVQYYPLPWEWLTNEGQLVGSYDPDEATE